MRTSVTSSGVDRSKAITGGGSKQSLTLNSPEGEKFARLKLNNAVTDFGMLDSTISEALNKR
jgi:hypothetical protein